MKRFTWIGALGMVALCQCAFLVDLNRLDTSNESADGFGYIAAAEGDAYSADALDSVDARQDDALGDAAAESIAPHDAVAEGGATDGDARNAAAEGAAGDDVVNGDVGDVLADVPEGGSGSSPDGADGDSDSGSDACPARMHSNGVGEAWQDCIALDTYNAMEAQNACNAHAPMQNCHVSSGCNASYVDVSLTNAGTMTTYLWVYATLGPSGLSPGDVLVFPTGNVLCSNLPRPAATWH